MNLCYGVRPRPLMLRSTRRYLPEHLEALCRRLVNQPLFLRVENEYHPVPPPCLPFACLLVASYHNQIAHNLAPEDGSMAETEDMEWAAQAHMEAPDSDLSDTEDLF